MKLSRKLLTCSSLVLGLSAYDANASAEVDQALPELQKLEELIPDIDQNLVVIDKELEDLVKKIAELKAQKATLVAQRDKIRKPWGRWGQSDANNELHRKYEARMAAVNKKINELDTMINVLKDLGKLRLEQ